MITVEVQYAVSMVERLYVSLCLTELINFNVTITVIWEALINGSRNVINAERKLT